MWDVSSSAKASYRAPVWVWYKLIDPKQLFGQVQRKNTELWVHFCPAVWQNPNTPKIRLHPSHPGQQIYRSKLAQWVPVHAFNTSRSSKCWATVTWDPHPSMDTYKKLATHQQNMESLHHQSDGNAKVIDWLPNQKIHSCRLQAFVYGSKPQYYHWWTYEQQTNG